MSAEVSTLGTKDGQGACDNDRPYEFHRRPRAESTMPFSTREYARLLILRSRIHDGSFADDTGAAQLLLRQPPADVRMASPWMRCVDCGGTAPLAHLLGAPMRCPTCDQNYRWGIADAILYTAGVVASCWRALFRRRMSSPSLRGISFDWIPNVSGHSQRDPSSCLLGMTWKQRHSFAGLY